MKKKELDRQLKLMKEIQENVITQHLFTHSVYEYKGNVVWFKEKELSELPYYSSSMHEALKYDTYVNNKQISSLESIEGVVESDLAQLIKEQYPEYSHIEIKILNLAPPVFLFEVINLLRLGTIDGKFVLNTMIEKLEPKFWELKMHNTNMVLEEIQKW